MSSCSSRITTNRCYFPFVLLLVELSMDACHYGVLKCCLNLINRARTIDLWVVSMIVLGTHHFCTCLVDRVLGQLLQQRFHVGPFETLNPLLNPLRAIILSV
jgi:hypothetical protein